MKTLMSNSAGRWRTFCWMFGLSVAIASILIPGCSANSGSLTKSGGLALEKHPSDKVYIAWCDAYENEGGLLLTGVLKRNDHIGIPVKAHVEVTVMSSDGGVLQESSSDDVYVPRRITGKGQSLQRFEVRFPQAPSRGSCFAPQRGSRLKLNPGLRRMFWLCLQA